MAQPFEEKKFRQYTIKDGLSNNNITGIQQDNLGYIWIGTDHGLNRFDGTGFKQFLNNGKNNSIPGNAVFSINMIGQQLGVATDEGAQLIDSKTLNKKDLVLPSEESLLYWSNSCRYVCSDQDGNLGLSTKTGFYIFSPKGKLKQRYDRYTSKDIGQTWMMFGSHLYNLPDGFIMQQNSSGLLLYDHKKNIIANAAQYYPALRPVINLVKQRETFFFISDYLIVLLNTQNNSFDLIDIKNGTTKIFPSTIDLMKESGWQSKLSRIDEKTWALNCKSKGFYLMQIDTVAQTIQLLPEKYFSNYLCTVIFQDQQNRLWIGTDEGLFMQKTSAHIVDTFALNVGNGNDNFSINGLYVSRNRIFAGTDNNQIFVLDKQTRRVIYTIYPDTKKSINVIISFIRISQDSMWVATTSGLYAFDLKNYVCKKLWPGIITRPYKFFRAKDGTIWITSFAINTVYIFNPVQKSLDSLTKNIQPKLNVNFITSLAQDAENNIWIGGDAIARWNIRTKKIDTLIVRVPTQKNRKMGFTVMSDGSGNIWVSVNDDGFVRLTGSVEHIRPDNLVTDFKSFVAPDIVENKIFTQTNNGIAFLNTIDQKSIVFNSDDGLPQKTITSYQFSYDTAERSVWYASKNIISRIPLGFSSTYSKPPRFFISELSVLNDTTINHPSSEITLQHFQNDIRLNLSAINYTDPQNMRFAYRFKNDESESWTEMGTQPNLLLTNISPGTYSLLLKVYAYDNKWPEQLIEIQIHIRPPFWRTAWFLISVLLILFIAVYILYRNRIRQIEQRANLDSLLAQTEMKALHAQMNPHFIFNCLNSIREMILNNENRQASHYLSKFAQLIRITLNNSTKPFISLKETIDYLKRYLEMEKIRTNHFAYAFEIDEELEPEDTFVPPMLIQPFIENAIWHGQQPGKPMNLFIKFQKKENELICIVDDDGIGIEHSLKNKQELNHHSVGIANIRQRIELLNEKYNLSSSVLIEDKSTLLPGNENGTKITLHLAVKNAEI